HVSHCRCSQRRRHTRNSTSAAGLSALGQALQLVGLLAVAVVLQPAPSLVERSERQPGRFARTRLMPARTVAMPGIITGVDGYRHIITNGANGGPVIADKG